MQDWIAVMGTETPSGRAIAKKLRMEQYRCELVASSVSVDAIRALGCRGLILAGELDEGAAVPDPALLTLGIPVLAFGSAARSLLEKLGEPTGGDGLAPAVYPVRYQSVPLFAEVHDGERWLSRAEAFSLPAAYRVIAEAERIPVGYADAEGRIFLLQFGIERNDPDGSAILSAFASDVCRCVPEWTPEFIAQRASARIYEAAGEEKLVVCAISGGLDSMVAAMLAREVLGSRVRCAFVDTGLFREGESDEIERFYREELGFPVTRVDISQKVLEVLGGLAGMAEKRIVVEKEIGRTLCDAAMADGQPYIFVKGTNYLDVLSHAGNPVWPNSNVPAVYPLDDLFKEEIRMLGETLSLPAEMTNRQPFPGIGLAARIDGEVTRERLCMLRKADAIFTHEIIEAGQEKRVNRYAAMLRVDRKRTAIILRAHQGTEPRMNVARLPYDLLERTAGKIVEELPGVEGVYYDMTPGLSEGQPEQLDS